MPMRAKGILLATLVFAVSLVVVAFPLMAVLFLVSLEVAPVVGADLRNSVLGSVVGAGIILFGIYSAARVADAYAARVGS